MRRIVLAAVLACLVAFACAQNGKRTLVFVDDMEVKSTHSSFFQALTDRGFSLTYALASDTSIRFVEYGEWHYDNIILFDPTAESFAGSQYEQLVEFVDSGRNLLIAADSRVSDAVRDLAQACGISLDESGTAMIDHFNVAPADDGDHTLIISRGVIDAPIIVSNEKKAPILFRGIGMTLDDENELVLPLLSASYTAFSGDISDTVSSRHPPAAIGTKAVLVAALQARNNARVVVSGSLELFSNEFFTEKADGISSSGNQEFAVSVATWAFKERGVLKGDNIRHHRVGETDAPREYTIEDQVVYEVDISEWNGKKWIPYTANDVMMDFVRLDPHERRFLSHDGKGHYSIQFKAPDAYGVFQFKVHYSRKGYTFLRLETATPVRPFRHNQYERFIPGAYPYYAAAFSMMFGFVLFSAVFLYSRPPKTEK